MSGSRRRKAQAGEAIELTTFKITGSLRDFIAANADVDAWLATQPGFRMRRIAEQEDGTVIDLLLWDSVAHGERAAERLLVELRDSPVHARIQQRTVKWRVLSVQHAVAPRNGAPRRKRA